MRVSAVILGTALALLTAIVLVRHHLRDLYQVAQTYSTFYPYLRSHPQTLYRYPEPLQDASSALAPKIIHQIFLTEGRPSSKLAKYTSAVESCKNLHPDWTHNLWTDEQANQFMQEHYPAIWPHYQSYKQSIQRANILRYALLQHFGGVYLDIDITCLKPLDELRHVPFVTPGAYPAGVNNAFILARPGHKFLQHLLGGVESRDLTWGLPYIENMLSTGCMFFSNRWMSYTRSILAGDSAGEGDQIYILANAEGNMDPHMLRGAVTTPLFRHGGASSWHGWDAAVIVLIGEHYLLCLCALLAGITALSLLVWKLARRSRHSWSYVPLGTEGQRLSHDEESLDGKEG